MSNNEYRTAEVKTEQPVTSIFCIHYSTFCGLKAHIVICKTTHGFGCCAASTLGSAVARFQRFEKI